MMIGGFVCVLAAWLGLCGLCRELAARGRIRDDWRIFWILASIGWGVLLTLLMEATSAVQALTAGVLAIGWALSTLTIWIFVFLLRWRRRALAWRSAAQWAADKSDAWSRWPWDVQLMVLGAALVVALLGAVAAITPTTNWDSMTYHMPRVLQWIQQRSLQDFPTTNTRQVEFGPWASFAVANSFLLWGNDQFANMVQWVAMLGCVVVATLVARQLLDGVQTAHAAAAPAVALHDESTRWRIGALTCLFVVTIPIGITEAITTQNDYVTAYWAICAVALALALLSDPTNIWYTMGIGLAVGLGVLTKSTMAIFVAPLLAALLIWLMLRLRGLWLWLRLLVVLAITFAALNTPQMWRNYQVFSAPLSSKAVARLVTNESFTLSGTMSNVIRNLALHTSTGIAPATRYLNDILYVANRLTGRSLDDDGLTMRPTKFAFTTDFVVSDSYASGTYHLALIFVALFLCTRLRWPHDRRLLLYSCLPIASFCLFCAYLRWQPWHSRIHLAYFVALAPVVAIAIGSRGKIWANMLIFAVLMTVAAYCVFYNVSRPLNTTNDFLYRSREEQYFYSNQALLAPTRAIVDTVLASNCKDVGLLLGFEDWEYPLRLMLRERGFDGTFRQVFVANETASLQPKAVLPCMIIATTPRLPAEAQTVFPISVPYQPYTLYLTESASDWREVFLPDDRGHTGVLQQGQSLVFNPQGQLALIVRSGQRGTIELAGSLLVGSGVGRAANRLRVATNTGYDSEFQVGDQPMKLAIPFVSGTTAISMTLEDVQLPTNVGAALQHVQWSWRPADPTRVDVVEINNKNGIERLDNQPFFWIGNGATTIQVQSARPGTLTMRAHMILGPSLPGVSTRRLMVSTQEGYRQEEVIQNGVVTIRVPTTATQTTIQLTPLDTPTILKQVNGDTRPLLIGVQNLQVEMR